MKSEGENRDRRMTPDEAQAVIKLWSRRQWEREHWPTVADVAEGLGIEAGEAETLLAEVRAKSPSRPQSYSPRLGAGEPYRLLAAATGLTGFFCLYLERLLA